MVNKEDVLQLADLCKLGIANNELDKYVDEINTMIESLEVLKEVNTEDVEITYNVNNMKNPLRKDEVRESLPREEVLKNTVEEQYGYFKILKVID